MTITRRQFVQSSLLAGAGLLLVQPDKTPEPGGIISFQRPPLYPSESGFCFYYENECGCQDQFPAIRSAGLDFGRSVFGLTDNPDEGIPLYT